MSIESVKRLMSGPKFSHTIAMLDFTGSHAVAVFLGVCIRKHEDAQKVGCDSFPMSHEDWKKLFALTRKQVDNARSLLEPHGIISTQVKGGGPGRSTYYKLNMSRLEKALHEHTKTGKPLPRLMSLEEWRKPRG